MENHLGRDRFLVLNSILSERITAAVATLYHNMSVPEVYIVPEHSLRQSYRVHRGHQGTHQCVQIYCLIRNPS